MTLILSNQEVDQSLSMPECMSVLEDAYRELAHGRGVNRQRSDTLAPTTRPDALYSLKSMDGIAPKLGVGAVRINSDIVNWPSDGGKLRREKIPAAPGNRWVGLVLLFSTETGEPLAIFPDGYLQRLRVGATNGLGIKYLARTDAATAGLLGSGWQAGGQVMALLAVRPIRRVLCYSPNPDRRRAFARALSAETGVDIVAVDTPEQAIKGMDIVLCATNTLENIFQARWLEPGMHLSSIKRPEVEPAALQRADRVVIHAHESAPAHAAPTGLVAPERAAGKGWSLMDEVDFDALPTLPELIIGKTPARESPEQITCFLNNIGLGYQFAAAGAMVYRNAKARGLGRELPTDWFTQDVHP
jgi:ornithine cyclodeaminase/alanine dehydrogenase-like protein (mu-crystallin family)